VQQQKIKRQYGRAIKVPNLQLKPNSKSQKVKIHEVENELD